LAAMASQMILRCSKTGRLFFSAEEAQEHAEAFGAAYANFEEVSMESKVWVCAENGRPCYTEAEIPRLKARDPECKTFEEKTVAYLLQLQKSKEEETKRKERFFTLVDQKKLAALSVAKSHGRTRSAKALLATREKGTIEAAEAWIEEHSGEVDLDKLTLEFLETAFASADVPMSDGDVVMADAAPVVDERKPGDPNPPEIKENVKAELVKELIEMGFDEMKAEKALFKTDNQGVQFAVNWLAEHENDADIDLPLLPPPKAPPPKPKMSPEEAAAKAEELQKKMRDKKKLEEKISDKEKERMRVESVKMMNEASEKLKDEERKRRIAQDLREKEQHEKEKAALKEQLRQDYIDRFGVEPPPEETGEKEIKEKTSKDQLTYWLNQLKKNHKDGDVEALKTCLSTLRIYTKNLMENPVEVKFKKLKLENKAFQTRVASFSEAIEVLSVLGFDKKEDCLEQRKSVPDGWLCGNAIKFIDLMLGQL